MKLLRLLYQIQLLLLIGIGGVAYDFAQINQKTAQLKQNETLDSKNDSYGMSYTVGKVLSSNIISSQSKGNIFVSKRDQTGRIFYSFTFGGSGDGYGTAIDVDNEGNIYVTGMTTSTDFPFTNSAVQQRQAGVADAFVVKINPNLSGPESIVYATYLGGGASDMGLGIKVDKKGSAYITGRTNSPDFPVTQGSVQPYMRGGGEAFVAKLSPDGNVLDFSTFIGGSGSDYAYGIDLDETGNAYIAGTTDSPDFPISLNAFQMRLGGKADAFAVCLNGAGSQLLYSSFFGGGGFDDAFEINVDAVNAFHLSGTTDGDMSLNTPLRVEQDDKGNFKAAFTFESPVLVSKRVGK